MYQSKVNRRSAQLISKGYQLGSQKDKEAQKESQIKILDCIGITSDHCLTLAGEPVIAIWQISLVRVELSLFFGVSFPAVFFPVIILFVALLRKSSFILQLSQYFCWRCLFCPVFLNFFSSSRTDFSCNFNSF